MNTYSHVGLSQIGCLYMRMPISSSLLMEMTMSIRMVIMAQRPRTVKDVSVAF